MRGVTAAEAAEATLSPAMLVAFTVNVYAVPFVRLVTVQVVPVLAVQVRPPGEAVAVYVVIAEPPLDTGAVQLTLTC